MTSDALCKALLGRSASIGEVDRFWHQETLNGWRDGWRASGYEARGGPLARLQLICFVTCKDLIRV